MTATPIAATTLMFRTRTQEVEAVQWTGDNFEEAQAFCAERDYPIRRAPDEYPGMLMIDGHDDGFPCPGDYIVFELDGWLQGVQKAHKFEAQHEPVPGLVRTVAGYENLPAGTILQVEGDDDVLVGLGAGSFRGFDYIAEAAELVERAVVCSVVRLGIAPGDEIQIAEWVKP